MAIGQENQIEPKKRTARSFTTSFAEHARKFRAKMPSPAVLVVAAVILWILCGFYTVGTDEVGVVTRWGRFVYNTDPGLHYHLPFPIERAYTPRTGEVRKMEIGAPPARAAGTAPAGKPAAGAMLLTADGSLIEVTFTILYQVKNAENYLFNVAEPDTALRHAAEAVMSEVVGKSDLDAVLTTGKESIQAEVVKALQAVMDTYKAGIRIVAVQLQAVNPPPGVVPAFEAVVSAREQKDQRINRAKALADELVYEAQGESARILAQAQAYQDEKTKQAQGETARFLSLLAEYKKASDITRRRMYLEAMEEVLTKAGKIVLEPEKAGMLPLLNLPGPGRPASPAPRPE